MTACDTSAEDATGATNSNNSSSSNNTSTAQGDGNDQATTATTLQWGVSTKVNLSSNKDEDWYKLTAPRGGVLKFWIEGLPLSTTSPKIYASIYVETRDQATNSWEIPLDGTNYYMPALVKTNDPVWVYLYTCSSYGCNSFPTSDFIVRADLDTSDNGEWNNVKSRATTLVINAAPAVMKLYPENDVDWFNFTLTQDGVVQIRIDSGNSDELIHKDQKPFVTLMDAEGSATCFGCFSEWSSEKGNGFYAPRTLKAGSYHLKVGSYTGGYNSSYYLDKPLRIQVKQDSADPNGWHNSKASAVALNRMLKMPPAFRSSIPLSENFILRTFVV